MFVHFQASFYLVHYILMSIALLQAITDCLVLALCLYALWRSHSSTVSMKPMVLHMRIRLNVSIALCGNTIHYVMHNPVLFMRIIYYLFL